MVAEVQPDTIEVEDDSILEVDAPSIEVETAVDQPAVEETPAAEVETEVVVPKGIADLTDEELAEDPKVKSLLYRREQSARDRAKAEATSAAFAREMQYAASPEFAAELRKMAIEAPLDQNGNPQLDPKHIEQATGRLLGRGSATTVEQLATVLSTAAGPDFTLTPQEKTLADAAVLLYQQNPLNSGPLINAWLVAHDRSVLEKAEADIRAKIRREDAAEAAAKSKVEQAATAAAARKANPDASPIAGGVPASRPMTWDQIDQTYTDSQWNRLDAETRKRLSEAADSLRAGETRK